ncbi:conserved hypothetical protein [Talaromyces stipitatus ATCC 10500]|uniref:Uncharacterized protein n=1 Tax=Talaromyces stipitatus (strain ATCC 10500 / CBS 375.48 / QM 6759 / NRRL 1006) TaxID=441959 RepID=B8M5T4_TALSN|nr:uncharacterized protein TSTA_033080 [Talaromyces stipitatus ATCC 10500]EED20058.1 conserved hypothetical protein [Talaromyces stipitatus ATCC 10500]
MNYSKVNNEWGCDAVEGDHEGGVATTGRKWRHDKPKSLDIKEHRKEMSRLPSPPSEEDNARPPSRALDPVPLTSSIRTTPIHPQLPDIRIPDDAKIPSTHYHPVTCEPLNIAEIQPQLQHLRKEYPSMTAMLKAREDAVKEIKQKLEEKDRKRDEIQKALDKKVKEWDVEYKILSKYQASKS